MVRALCGETESGREVVLSRPDGSGLVLLSSTAPLRENDGVITGAVVVFRDITLQKSLEQHKNAFLSIASHELRTPLTAVQGFAEFLLRKAQQDPSLDAVSLRAINKIFEQSEYIARLVDELLDLSRIENGKWVIIRNGPGRSTQFGIASFRVLQSSSLHFFNMSLLFPLIGENKFSISITKQATKVNFNICQHVSPTLRVSPNKAPVRVPEVF